MIRWNSGADSKVWMKEEDAEWGGPRSVCLLLLKCRWYFRIFLPRMSRESATFGTFFIAR